MNTPLDPKNNQVIDVRDIPRERRHPLILATFDDLPVGASVEVVNNHDPLPLHYQFQVERHGLFDWQYLQRGPDVWHVRIERIA
ncbi:DUF2249 domain-containing protein [Deinococcus yavapaiensis]|uniref:Uncharacterized protein (DUF2249 family) n=1 Tax=Deinococcus yavapaiensis KR-236 TaxID=694435 RepID=A0A318S6N1_9DEIO|nr:DUF2249 domain-containing protein [Deinococcus yavapaiensis]PYE53873.1 uncharacterized protein (DUF2249 family) [Deinococcus yavapaiensis KR-236]